MLEGEVGKKKMENRPHEKPHPWKKNSMGVEVIQLAGLVTLLKTKENALGSPGNKLVHVGLNMSSIVTSQK